MRRIEIIADLLCGMLLLGAAFKFNDKIQWQVSMASSMTKFNGKSNGKFNGKIQLQVSMTKI